MAASSFPTMPFCPNCDARLIPDPDSGGLWCQFCGFRRDDSQSRDLAAARLAAVPLDYEPVVGRYTLSLTQQRVLDDAWEAIQAGDRGHAAMILKAARPTFENAADVWYLLSLTTSDRAQRLKYLDLALAEQPYHDHAWRAKGMLEGVIPADAPARDVPDTVADQRMPAQEGVEAASDTEACPLCGGALAFDAGAGVMICAHCGYRPDRGPNPLAPGAMPPYRDLDDALLQRRYGFSREWNIGSRVLVCQNCHAQITLSSTTFSLQCPFCDSAHILEQDAVGSFEQPDGVILFRLDRKAAARAVQHRLPVALRRQVVRGDITALYLPFWAFEGAALATVPLDQTEAQLAGHPMLRSATVTARDILVSGINRPPEAILEPLTPYNLDALVRYAPHYLARWPAQIYRTDVIQASLTARAYLTYAARLSVIGERLNNEPILARSDLNAYTLPETWWGHSLSRLVTVTISRLLYRLVLLPVWLITLHMQDGTRRPALVNGQTGEAIISDSFARMDDIIAGPDRVTRRAVQPIPLPRHR